MELTEEIVLKLLHEKTNRPMKFSELMKTFNIPEGQRREFRSLVRDMTEAGVVVKLRGGRYGLPDAMNLISGILQGHPDGYGFVTPDEGGADLFIGRQKMGGAMHGDHVVARVEQHHRGFGRAEGRILRILHRNTSVLVGLFEPLDRDGWVVPSEQKYFQDVFIPGKSRKKARAGQMVKVEITDYPTRHHPPVGRVLEVLGDKDDPEVEMRAIFHKHHIRIDFPPKVIKEAEAIQDRIPEEEIALRRDLRDDMIFTIDGEKSKDFDDAISLERDGEVFRLGVHIADVSHFVTENSPLDEEAFERGTSIYYADGVVPMLPFHLTNHICSLKPNVDRLTLTAQIEFDLSGNIIHYEIYPSVIRSKIRFTYTQVDDLLQNGDSENQFGPALTTLKDMRDLSQTLRKNRFREGSVDFNIPEAEIEMTSTGTVKTIRKAPRNQAHELIEEFMLAANQVVARHLDQKNLPGIHRIHEQPDEDKLYRFNAFIQDFGFRLPSLRNVKSTHLQNFLERIKDHPEERVFNTLLLRSMKKAVYSETDPGHFCLGFEHYTHFTSPIRRYPDLVTHRMVKQYLPKKKCTQRQYKLLLPQTRKCALQSSDMEIKAQDLEREVRSLRQTQFMKDKVGQTFWGTISSVAQFGLFVELDDIFVEGMVHVSSLHDDYYVYYEHEHLLKGQHKNQVYRIGDRVRVRVARVDLSKKQIDFSLAPG